MCLSRSVGSIPTLCPIERLIPIGNKVRSRLPERDHKTLPCGCGPVQGGNFLECSQFERYIMVWIVEWTQPGQNKLHITAWTSQDEARAAACADIMADITTDWDLTDPDQSAAANTISDECAAMNWQAAIDAYNEWEGDGDFELAQFFRVYERPVQNKVPSIHLLKPLNTNNVSTIPAPPSVQAFKATVEGSTCRGPCKTYNEYAYADRSDSTHVCFQCKYMSEVFGKDP